MVAMSRSESPELTALAAKYVGVLVLFKGDVSKDEDNKATVNLAMQSFSRLDALVRTSCAAWPVHRKAASLTTHVAARSQRGDM